MEVSHICFDGALCLPIIIYLHTFLGQYQPMFQKTEVNRKTCTFTHLTWNGSNFWHGDSFQRSDSSHKYWMCGVVTSYINIFLTALSHLCQHSHIVLDGSGRASIGARCSAGSLSPNRKGFTVNLTCAQWVLSKTQKITFGVLTKGW